MLIEKDLLEIQALKDQVRAFYPGQQLDLSEVNDIETARRALFFAEKGLKAEILLRCIKIDLQKRKAGSNVFARIKFWESYLRIAPSCLFREGFNRTDRQRPA